LKGEPAITSVTSEPPSFGDAGPDALRDFLADRTLYEVRDGADAISPAAHATILVDGLLQDIPDYRAALQAWFAGVSVGGHLVLTVPHAFLAERQLSLPVRDRPMQRRLYTPAALMTEIEEALAPNSYRVRLLCDDDRGYDYAAAGDAAPAGKRDIALAIQKIALPAWALDVGAGREAADGPDYAFAPPRTRIERPATVARKRVLILKLDHLGDFVMGLPALERARSLFSDAQITLVVGSWNLDLARRMEIADTIISFDAFPRNSAEEEPDVAGKRALFDATVPDHYDLAIDLRTDTDTRTLLGRVRASFKAGIGRKTDFPFLDIPLAIEVDRIDRESARENRLDHHAFSSQDVIRRLDHRAVYDGQDANGGQALIWGPYWRLRKGHYLFEPFLEIAPGSQGILMLDVAINFERRVRAFVATGDRPRLEFDIDADDSSFEFRIWAADEIPAPSFSFYGGKLIRAGAPGILHQSDYLELLLDLVARRVDRVGLLTEVAQ
jgi:hypothetical protein